MFWIFFAIVFLLGMIIYQVVIVYNKSNRKNIDIIDRYIEARRQARFARKRRKNWAELRKLRVK